MIAMTTKIAIGSLLFTCAFLTTVNGQQKEIRQVIDTFFEGMRTGDSSLIHTTITNDATLVTVTQSKEKGGPVMVEESVKDFLTAIGTTHDQPYNEPIWNVVIQSDGDIAHVWCDYAFYLGNTFYHCGVDSFLLFKDIGGWKIFHIADTRRRSDCNVPEDVKRRFSK